MAEQPYSGRLVIVPPEQLRTIDQAGPDGPPPAFDDLYQEIIRSLGFDQKTVDVLVKVEDMQLPKGSFRLGGYTPPGAVEDILGDDRLRLLIIDDVTVALSLERRDDLNWTEISSACFLTAGLAADLQARARRLERTKDTYSPAG